MDLLKQLLSDDTHECIVSEVSIHINDVEGIDTSSFSTFINTLPANSIIEDKVEKQMKPRAKHVNDVLRSKKGGAHYSPKTDFKRSKEKEQNRKTLNEE